MINFNLLWCRHGICSRHVISVIWSYVHMLTHWLPLFLHLLTDCWWRTRFCACIWGNGLEFRIGEPSALLNSNTCLYLLSMLPASSMPVHAHTHTRLTALCPGLPGWAGGTRKVKPIWILLKQETVSGNGISWTVKSAPRSRQITTPAPHHSVFYRPDALPDAQSPNQQCQGTEGQ